jgi:hypothetical protein
LTDTFGLLSEAWQIVAFGFQCVDFCVNTSFGTPSGTRKISIMNQEMLNQYVHRAMVNQSEVLMNSVHNAIRDALSHIQQRGYTTA